MGQPCLGFTATPVSQDVLVSANKIREGGKITQKQKSKTVMELKV